MSETRRVLVVDDEPSDNEFLTLTIRGLGFHVDTVFDGQAALDHVSSQRPDLVFLDALLPKVDGFAVLKEIRRLHPDVPVVMLSGIYRKRSYEAEAIGSLGASSYVLKPVGVMQIWDLAEKHLGMAKAGQAVTPDFPGVPFWRKPLAATVADLHQGAVTGLLFVRGTGGSSVLFFEDGALVFARSGDPATRLDRVLQAMGKLDDKGMARAAELMSSHRGALLGDLLVAEKMLSEDDVKAALARQQQEHLTRPFTWPEGACQFFGTDAPRRETFKMQVDLVPLLSWACRHLAVDDNLVRWLPRGERRPKTAEGAAATLERVQLGPGEAEFLRLCDGTRSIAKLRAIARLVQVDGERLLAMAIVLGLVEIADNVEAAMVSPPPVGACSVPVAGDLAKYPPALLLMSLALGRKTGIVTFDSDESAGTVTRTVYVQAGLVALASSSHPHDRLGQVLVRNGIVTSEQVGAALEAAAARPGVVLGRLLLEQGALGPDDLHRGLVAQVQQVVAALLGWTSGTFRFQERDLPSRDVVPLDLDTRQVLLDAFRTCAFSDVMARLPPPETRIRRTAACHDLASDLPLTALEDRILLEADGRRSLQDLAAGAREGAEPVLRAAQALMSLGLVEGFVAPVEAPPPAPAAPRAVAVAVPVPVPVPANVPATVTGSRVMEGALLDGPDPAPEELSFGPDDTRSDFTGLDLDAEPFDATGFTDSVFALPLDGGDFGGGGAPAAEPVPEPARAAVATAVVEPSVDEFLRLLAEAVRGGYALLPDSLWASLPPDLRSRLKV